MTFENTIPLLAAFAAGVVATLIFMRIQDLKQRIAKLEDAQQKHLPYRCADEIEEATAILNSEIFHNEFRRELLENVRGHLFNARTPGN